MVTVLFRTLIVYGVIATVMRCMGKRQVGELDFSDLVATLLLSEVAALPLADAEMPLLRALLPALLILCLEIILTYLKNKLPFLKLAMEGKPSILILNGRPDRRELERSRISLEELLSECRIKGYPDISDIMYAILEQNGQISILPRAEKAPACPGDINVRVKEKGLPHALILDGQVQEQALTHAGLDRAWLDKACRERGLTADGVFYMTRNDAGEIYLLSKKEAKK